eukprot:COSAG05_NODE_17_length_35518_cov_34.728084_29_plen_379_part_00
MHDFFVKRAVDFVLDLLLHSLRAPATNARHFFSCFQACILPPNFLTGSLRTGKLHRCSCPLLRAAMTTKVVSATVAMAAAGTVAALPPWSWDTLQTYVHCANYTGEWNDEALAVLAKQPFVVFEKYHKAFEQPQFDRAESKIVESCRKVKRLNPKTDCYIYTESDWARTEYSLGHWFDAHPSAELQCPSPGDFVGTNDTLCGWEAGADYSANRSRKPCNGQLKHLHYRAYDFNNSDAREKWIERVTNATSSGVVDGAFIDGNRGGFGSSVTGHCSAEKRTGWAAGLEQAVATLSRRLGPSKTLISVCASSWRASLRASHFHTLQCLPPPALPLRASELPHSRCDEACCRRNDGARGLDPQYRGFRQENMRSFQSNVPA